jgi:hypothetical protein
MNDAKKRINEDFSPTFPYDDIKCKDCVFRKPDLVIDGNVVVKGYKNGYCKVYTQDIRGKPNEILFNGADRKHYRKDDS